MSAGLFFLDLFYPPVHPRGAGMGGEPARVAETGAIRRGRDAATPVTGNFQAPAAGQACALCATPFSSSSVSSSPDWNISVTISHPPTNSPFT